MKMTNRQYQSSLGSSQIKLKTSLAPPPWLPLRVARQLVNELNELNKLNVPNALSGLNGMNELRRLGEG
jgi:hypothetical protein